jgi:hypothetical protein
MTLGCYHTIYEEKIDATRNLSKIDRADLRKEQLNISGLGELVGLRNTNRFFWIRPLILTKLHCKKRLADFPSPAEMSLTKLSLGGNN